MKFVIQNVLNASVTIDEQIVGKKLKYLIIPELHADKVHYHFHGLLADCGGMVFSRNLKKPEIVEYNLTPEQWVDMVACISDDIGYMKNVVSEKCGQRVTYIELNRSDCDL